METIVFKIEAIDKLYNAGWMKWELVSLFCGISTFVGNLITKTIVLLIKP